jgi:hypothetical protein
MAFRHREHSDACKFLIFGVIWRTRELIEAIEQGKRESLMAVASAVVQPSEASRKKEEHCKRASTSLKSCLENVHL